MKNSMPTGQRGDVINNGDLGREQQKVHIALPVAKKNKIKLKKSRTITYFNRENQANRYP